MKNTLMVLFCVLMSANAPAQTTQTYRDIIRKWQSGQPIRAVMIGNSIGQGYYATGWEKITVTGPGDSRGRDALSPESRADQSINSVTNQLGRLLRSKNPNSVLINESVGGWDSNMVIGLTARVYGEPPVDLIGNVIATSPRYDVAFLPFQINDLSHELAFESFKTNQRTMVGRLIEAGIVPVLVKENPVDKPYWLPQWTRFMAEIDAIAADTGAGVIDTYTPFLAAIEAGGGFRKAPLLHDYLHPNQAGHDIMFRAYAAWFNQTLPPVERKEKQDLK